MKFCLSLFLTVIALFGVDPVTQSRLAFGGTWAGKVGVEGGIPSAAWTQAGSTIAAYGSSGTPGSPATINSAITAAGANEYVLLGAGTFFLNAAIEIDESGVELRGSVDANGVPTTIIDFRGGSEKILIQGASWDLSTNGQFTRRAVTSGVTRGSTSVVLASAPTGLSAGMIMFLSGTDAVGDDNDFYSLYSTDPFYQIVRVTDVTASTVTFNDPINADYLTSGNCQVGYRTAAGATIRKSGVRNLSLLRGGGTGGHYLKFAGTDECWAYNIKTYEVPSSTYHCYLYGTYRTEIRHCDMAHMANLTNSTYCIFAQGSTGWLIEDNYFHDSPNVMPYQACGGGAFTYNYVNDLPYDPADFLSQIVFAHGGHNHYNIFEGNWLATGYHNAGGSAVNQTWFRNRMRGYDATGLKTGNTKCLTIEHGGEMTGFTYAGNVLGEDGYHTTVSSTFSGTSGNFAEGIIYMLHDDVVDFQKFGNYNTVNDAVPAGEAVGGGDALVTSYLHVTKPSWFASLPWPWVNPSNYGQSNNRLNLPAGYRAANGFALMAGGTVTGLTTVANLTLATEAATPWSTSYPTGLTALFEADTAGAYSNDDPVTSWADTSATNVPATTTSAANPVFKTAMVNGLPIVRFSGTHALGTAAVAGSTWFSTNRITIFVVLSSAGATSSTSPTFSWIGSATDTVHAFLDYGGDGKLYFRHADATGISVAKPDGFNIGFHSVRLTRGALSAGEIMVDGASLVTGTFPNVLAITPTAPLFIGSNSAAATSIGFSGDIATIMIYNRELTAEETTAVNLRNNTKYGL